jgi:mono/diheme cytochrome c family protein
MTTRPLPCVIAAVLTLALVTTHAGGWAVVTVEDLPEQFVAGQATTLTFSVRQHGMRLIGGLSAGVTARSGSRHVETAATAMETGYYAATVTLPAPGEWTITVHSGFGASNTTLLPVNAVATAAASSPAPTELRGRQLFVAKGCNTCHVHGSVNIRPPAPAGLGADLTDKRYSDVLLAKILTDPSMLPPVGPFGMPDLNLRQQEVAALIAFINRPRTRS